MSRVGTIRFRLTAWYALIMTVIVTAVSLVSWIAARQSLSVTVDRSLSRDMDVFRASVKMHAGRDPGDIVQVLESSTIVGLRDTLVRVFDANGSLVYQSPGLAGWLRVQPPQVDDGRLVFRTALGDHE